MDGDDIVDRMYRRHGATMTRSLARGLRRRDDAADLMHGLFVKFLNRARSGPIDTPAAYLHRMAANDLVSAARRDCREHSMAEALLDSQNAGFDPHVQLESRDLLQRIDAALGRLKPRTRQIFLAHRLEGLSYGEIAAQHGLSVKGVEKQMSKALAHIDRCLDRGGR